MQISKYQFPKKPTKPMLGKLPHIYELLGEFKERFEFQINTEEAKAITDLRRDIQKLQRMLTDRADEK